MAAKLIKGGGGGGGEQLSAEICANDTKRDRVNDEAGNRGVSRASVLGTEMARTSAPELMSRETPGWVFGRLHVRLRCEKNSKAG